MRNEDYEKQLKELQELKHRVTKSLCNAPEGTMRCEMSKGKYPQYYVVKGNDKGARAQYIRKADMELARAYAQKEYDLHMLKNIEDREKLLSKQMTLENMDDICDIFTKLPEAKRCLVTPYVLSDADYVEAWKKSFETGENDTPMINAYTTENGEQVRSKSEKMIADKLYFMGIPYLYETTLKLENGQKMFPDFVILNVKMRKDFFLEHFGMMDNPEYCKKAITKMETYEKNKIYLGERLFITFESSLKGINLKQIDSIIERFL